MLRVNDLTVETGHRLLAAEVSFTVAPGDVVGLVGPNGAGKTTLFLCLAGVLPVRPGMVRVAGLDPGVSAQRRQLPASTANAALGRIGASRARDLVVRDRPARNALFS